MRFVHEGCGGAVEWDVELGDYGAWCRSCRVGASVNEIMRARPTSRLRTLLRGVVCRKEPLLCVILTIADHQRVVFGEDPPTEAMRTYGREYG